MALSLIERPVQFGQGEAPRINLNRYAPEEFARQAGGWVPRTRLGWGVFRSLAHLPADLAAELLDAIRSAVVIESSLRLKVERTYRGRRVADDLGIVCTKVVTTAGVNAIVDAFQNTVELETFKFHGIGVGNASDLAEAASNTVLFSELTTEYNPDNTRATGSTIEGASANIYRTVGTNTVDAAVGIEEHGVFSDVDSGQGTLLDRSTFAIVNLADGDSLQSTYDLTFTAGG